MTNFDKIIKSLFFFSIIFVGLTMANEKVINQKETVIYQKKAQSPNHLTSD